MVFLLFLYRIISDIINNGQSGLKVRAVYKSHKELVSLLRKGTPDEFREGMRRHLENHFVRILAEPSGQDASK